MPPKPSQSTNQLKLVQSLHINRWQFPVWKRQGRPLTKLLLICRRRGKWMTRLWGRCVVLTLKLSKTSDGDILLSPKSTTSMHRLHMLLTQRVSMFLLSNWGHLPRMIVSIWEVALMRSWEKTINLWQELTVCRKKIAYWSVNTRWVSGLVAITGIFGLKTNNCVESYRRW
jgi:hypothetical protein